MSVRKYSTKRMQEMKRRPMYFFKGKVEERKRSEVEHLQRILHENGFTLPEMYVERIAHQLYTKISELQDKKSNESVHDFISINVDKPEYSDRKIALKITVSPKGSVRIIQYPLIHGIRAQGMPAFETLQSILEKGFRGGDFVNSHLPRLGRRHIASSYPARHHITEGDYYGLEMMAPFDFETRHAGRVIFASPEQISAINIRLNRTSNPEEIKEKIAFYKRELKKYDIPVRFVKPWME